MTPSEFIARWRDSGGAERANAQPFLNDLAWVLDVPRPDPATGDAARDGFIFERPVNFQDGTKDKGYIDLYRRGTFVLETKQGADEKRNAGGTRLRQGHGLRNSRAWEAAMHAARNQAEGYARNLDASEPTPPFVIICDVGFCIDLFADFSGTGRLYRPFPDAASNRISLSRLEDPSVRELLASAWQDPLSLDPARRQARVTVRLASSLADLARQIDGSVDADGRPMDADAVAAFLSRSLFAMFAEDAGLIPDGAFTRLLDAYAGSLDHLPHALGDFFQKMDTGGFVGEVRARLPRFNGALFKDSRAPRLSSASLKQLAESAHSDWKNVEPSIFGTLMERALDPAERHRLGAHFTPRTYVERLVGPTILEPLHDEWEAVRAEAESFVERAEEAANDAARTRLRNDARRTLAAFLHRLATIRVLDPACGTGNFLYVTFAGLKALEDEARRVSERLVGEAIAEGFGVTPRQMRGIEINPRAAHIADLVLWIGYLQWNRARYGDAQPLAEPILEGYGQVEHRDAVLNEDGTQAEWPEADFIVGNPPFVGNKRMRDVLGDAYTERLRAAYPGVPDSADYVMNWWYRAAQALWEGRATRFGFITTNSLTQTFNRRVIEAFTVGDNAVLALSFAIPDHPWVDEKDGAAVRISMTVAAPVDRVGSRVGRLEVVTEETEASDGIHAVETVEHFGRINADLTIGADVTTCEPLASNQGLSSRGVTPVGTAGFVLTPDRATELGRGSIAGLERYIRPYLNGRDLTATNRGLLIIDAWGLSAEELRIAFPQLHEHLLRNVRPLREQRVTSTKDSKDYAARWWQYGKTRPELRKAIQGLTRFIGTPYVAKHRFFVFLEGSVLPDEKVVAIASGDGFVLGVLSSRAHEAWSLRAGGSHGVGNDPSYNNSLTFDPFPFPAATLDQTARIRELGEAIDAHRKSRQAADATLTLTNLYNAVEALRAGRQPEARDRAAAESGLAHTLLDLHRRLDRAVLEAYGWADLDAESSGFRPAILERLVVLNRERRDEELAGHVRWLRPEFQAPNDEPQTGLALSMGMVREDPVPFRRPWPDTFAARLAAVRQLADSGRVTAADVQAQFEGASRDAAQEVIDTLAERGLLRPG